jgi:hypothetical protein
VPAPRKHPPPLEHLRTLLAEARAEGLDFDAAWERAVGKKGPSGERIGGTVRFPHATVHRRSWRQALEATIEEWRAAYENRETPLTRAIEHLLTVGILDMSRDAWRVADGKPAMVALVPMPGPDCGPLTDEHRALMPPEYDFAGNRLETAA